MNKLRKLRMSAGLTQVALAEKIGMAQPSYARYELGTRDVKNITLENAVKIAKAFGCHAEDLIDDGKE